MAEKLCPNCKNWTNWQKKNTDKCLHCGHVLGIQAIKEKEAWVARDIKQDENDWFKPRETDGPIKAFFRKVAFIFHMIFGAITMFFIWMFSAGPG